MVHDIHQTAFYFHVTCGALALIVFWLPMLGKKGTAFHKLYGKVFAYGMYAVSVSGFIMAILVLADPIGVRVPEGNLDAATAISLAERNRIFSGFLLMLSVLVFASVKHSILVLRAKTDRSVLRAPWHVTVMSVQGVMGLAIGVIGVAQGNILFLIFAVIATLSSYGMLHYTFKKEIKAREWFLQHLGNIIGAGIGAYTAFFAFGGSRLFAELFAGQLQFIPWIIPGVVGITATNWLTRKYARHFRVA